MFGLQHGALTYKNTEKIAKRGKLPMYPRVAPKFPGVPGVPMRPGGLPNTPACGPEVWNVYLRPGGVYRNSPPKLQGSPGPLGSDPKTGATE